MNKHICKLASRSCKPEGQWRHLGNYFGMYGTVCAHHYECINHDAYSKPRHPKALAFFRKRLSR